jgi:hypothetical protein
MLLPLYVIDRRPPSLTLVTIDNASGDIFLTLRDSRARSGRRQLSQSQRMRRARLFSPESLGMCFLQEAGHTSTRTRLWSSTGPMRRGSFSMPRSTFTGLSMKSSAWAVCRTEKRSSRRMTATFISYGKLTSSCLHQGRCFGSIIRRVV